MNCLNNMNRSKSNSDGFETIFLPLTTWTTNDTGTLMIDFHNVGEQFVKYMLNYDDKHYQRGQKLLCRFLDKLVGWCMKYGKVIHDFQLEHLYFSAE